MTDVYWMSQSATLRARQAMLENNELQPIITASVCCGFVEVLQSVVNFVLNRVLIGLNFNELDIFPWLMFIGMPCKMGFSNKNLVEFIATINDLLCTQLLTRLDLFLELGVFF